MGDDPRSARSAQGEHPGGGEPGSDQRSGDFSRDPAFDPEELFAVIERDASAERVLFAMREFRNRGATELFAHGVALYARSARARGESVETVLGTLETIADELEQDTRPGFAERETPLRTLLLRGVLLAFYGGEVVQREEDARRERVERRHSARRRDDG